MCQIAKISSISTEGYFDEFGAHQKLSMFQDADDISHHLNAHVIQDVLKGVEMKLVKFCPRENSTAHGQLDYS